MEQLYINLKEQDDYYVWKWLREHHKKDLISIEDLIGFIEDLIDDVEHLKEKIEDSEKPEELDYDPYDRYMDNKLENE